MTSTHKDLKRADYHVAWICPVADVELLPARLMLDEEYPTPTYDTHYDENTYICGTIKGHTVVIATCPQGETGNVNAGRLTGPMFKTFPNIRMAVLVGIGGGIPRAQDCENALDDIHLGDVAVGWPGDGKPACVYHDRGRSQVGRFEMIGTMADPDWRLSNALSILASDHRLGQTKFRDQLARLQDHKEFAHPGFEHDRLFKAGYHHIGAYNSNCAACDKQELVQRPSRTEDDKSKMVFHRGRIATGNSVIQNAELRDQISGRCDGAICVEMEAAGVEVNRKCLVIRGISDYADSHKSDVWRSCAAGKAAAFTRELLCRVQSGVIKAMEEIAEAPWLVPFTRPFAFIGRENQLARLSEHVLMEDSRRLAIYGLGGCGKTALALVSAYRIKEQQPARAIFWVPAFNPESFEQAYRDIGTRLGIPGITANGADVKKLVKERLGDPDFGQWLMIVDNADDTSIFSDSSEKQSGVDRLIDWLPLSRKGSFIFTTRTRKIAIDLAGSNVICLSELDESEAKEMLKQQLLRKDLIEGDEVYVFLKILAYLPLAIVQAVAFVNGNNTRLSQYTDLFIKSETDATDLLSAEFEDQGRYQNTKNPVATTWYISFKYIQQKDPLASEYLSFMACTTGENVPASLLPHESTGRAHIEAIGTLDAYAFITIRQQRQRTQQARGQEEAFDIHQLVRLATRAWLREHNQWDIWAEKALTRLVEVVPFGDYKTWEIWIAYLPHGIHVVNLSELYNTGGRILLLDRIGYCERELGHFKAAKWAFKQVLDKREESLGKGHPDTLSSKANYATALSDMGEDADAENMLRETLAMSEITFGRENPFTLVVMSYLGQAISVQRKYAEAEQIHREEIALSEKVLGKEYRDTLKSMDNLGWALSGQRKDVEAEQIHREALFLSEKVLGKEHRDTLKRMNYLGRALSGQKRHVEAERIHREALFLSEKVLGKEHRDTLRSMNYLGKALSSQEKYVEAEQMHRETLFLSEKVLGKEHRVTLVVMDHLGGALSGQGKYMEAEKMYQRALDGYEKALGHEHIWTLRIVFDLGNSYRSQGRLVEAETMYQRALDGYEKAQGCKHVRTLQVVNNAGILYQRQGKLVEAEKMYQRALDGLEKALGHEHTWTLVVIDNLRTLTACRAERTEVKETQTEALP
ncbi:MAG: hypothetical protein Q9184_005895 [Pyrenodesmia sp. 2 TL-2023]